jgi:hypothetical protein
MANNIGYYTAIVFFHPEQNKRPFKYRNINREDNFKDFCKTNVKLEGALYFNLYSKETKEFIKRVWIN